MLEQNRNIYGYTEKDFIKIWMINKLSFLWNTVYSDLINLLRHCQFNNFK